MAQTITQRVFELIAKQGKIDPSEVQPDSTLASLNIPSLGAVELIFDIEDEFDINFPEDEGTDFNSDTAQGLVDIVKKVLAEKGQAEANG